MRSSADTWHEPVRHETRDVGVVGGVTAWHGRHVAPVRRGEARFIRGESQSSSCSGGLGVEEQTDGMNKDSQGMTVFAVVTATTAVPRRGPVGVAQ